MIKRLSKLFLQIIALSVTIGIPIVATHDAMHPWPPAIKLIDQERSGYIPIAAGIAATGSTITQESYILIPKRFTSPAILTVKQTDNGRTTADKDTLSFWFVFAFFLYGLYVIFDFTRWLLIKLKGKRGSLRSK